jgi:hypothetical protein
MEKSGELKNEKVEDVEKKEVLLSDIEIKDPNIALNVLVSFVNLANKRGAFGLQESAKIWECVQQFQKGQQ